MRGGGRATCVGCDGAIVTDFFLFLLGGGGMLGVDEAKEEEEAMLLSGMNPDI